MTQTLSINALDTKKIDAMESELIQLNNLTPSEIIARMNQLHDKYSLEYKKDKDKMSSELRVKYEELLAAMKRDMAEMEWKMNSSEKTGVHMQTLDALRNFQSVAVTTSAKQTIVQSTEKSAEVISVTQKTPETFTVNMDATSAEALKKFQKSAAEAFKAEVLGSDGKPDYLSLRRGLELISSLEELQSIDTKAFDTLKDEEKEKLKEQLPAVRGVIGAIFVESLFADGYTIAFNGDGTVNMRARSGISDVNQKMSEINTAIKRDPTLSQTLKMGLLYADGDLLKYMQSVATSDGNNITPEMQTPGEFLKYLNNRDQNTLAGDAIKSSANFFENINLPEQMKAANYIPEIGNALSAIMPDPNAMVSVQKAMEGVNQTVTNSNGQSMGAGTAFIKGMGAWASDDNLKSVPTLPQDWKENGFIGGTLNQIGHTGMVGLKEMLNSPESRIVVALAIIGSFFFFGFKKTMLGVLAAPFAAGFVSRLGDDITGREKADMPQTREATDNERKEAASATYATQEEANEAVAKTDPVKTADPNELKKYIAGDTNANLTSEQKQYLDAEGNKEAVNMHIDQLRKQLADKYTKGANPPFTEEWLIEMNNFINSQNISQLEFLLTETDEQMRARILSLNSKEWNPFGVGETAEAIWEFIKEHPWISSGMLMVILFALGKAGTVASLPLSLAGAIITRIGWRKLWDAFIAAGQKVKARLNRTKSSSNSNSPNPTPDSPNTPNAPSSTPERGTNSRAEYQRQLGAHVVEQENLAQDTRKTFRAGAESKAHQKSADNAKRQLDTMNETNNKRPFANETSRHVHRDILTLQTEVNTINTRITELTNEIANLENQRNASTDEREKRRLGTQKTQAENELTQKRTELQQKTTELNTKRTQPGVTETPKIQVGGHNLDLTPQQALEYDRALMTLEKYDGKQIYAKSSSTRVVTDQAALDEIRQSLETIARIRSGSSHAPLSSVLDNFDTRFFDVIDNGRKSIFSMKKFLQALV